LLTQQSIPLLFFVSLEKEFVSGNMLTSRVLGSLLIRRVFSGSISINIDS